LQACGPKASRREEILGGRSPVPQLLGETYESWPEEGHGALLFFVRREEKFPETTTHVLLLPLSICLVKGKKGRPSLPSGTKIS